MKWSCTKD